MPEPQKSTLMKVFIKFRDTALNMEADIVKANDGNKTAGRRARKALMETKMASLELRKLITDSVA